MNETAVQTRYFVKTKPPLTGADLAMWLNEAGDSADTLRTMRITVHGRSVCDVCEVSEAQVECLKKSEHRKNVHVFVKGTNGVMSVHHNFPTWR